jgi:hypothetical protein
MFDVFTMALLNVQFFWGVTMCHWASGFGRFKDRRDSNSKGRAAQYCSVPSTDTCPKYLGGMAVQFDGNYVFGEENLSEWPYSTYEGCPKSKCTDFLFKCLLDLPEITSYLLKSMTLGKLHSGSNVFFHRS